uniref:Uncharacterized protein n=1 Tax=Romanomermis culicivorax TaxID=13658 RepID=A0A915K389_ROMCU
LSATIYYPIAKTNYRRRPPTTTKPSTNRRRPKYSE